jgi:hypothetical protein
MRGIKIRTFLNVIVFSSKIPKRSQKKGHMEIKSLCLSVVNGIVDTSTIPSCHTVKCFYLDKGHCPGTMCSRCCFLPYSQ